jgi:hypothetical protein
VDSHRSPLFVISAYNRRGTFHRFANTTDVLVTIEEILGLAQLSQFDYYGRPLREVFQLTATQGPFQALTPAQSLTERNPSDGPGARESERLDFRFEDVADEDTFNRVLGVALKGEKRPYPGTARLSPMALKKMADH